MGLKNRLPKIMASLPASVNAAVGAGAKVIEQSAKEKVHVRTGQLRERIHVEQDGGDFHVVAGDEDTFWGHLEEHGTVNNPPHPFLVPAADENQKVVVSLVAASLRRL